MPGTERVAPFTIEASAGIAAPASRVYALLADYHVGHPSIVPPNAFSNLRVLEGGVGAGTRISYDARVMGRTFPTLARVEEPEPGRRMVERIEGRDVATTFLVEPAGEGCRVTIRTEFPDPRHPLAFLERWLTRRAFLPIYAEELRLIADRTRAEP